MFATDVRGAIREIEAIEIEARRLEARRAELFNQLELSAVYRTDGHSSAKVMVRHVAKLSGVTAARRQRIARVAKGLPEIADALAEGRIGVDQVDLLGRVHANRRVRHFMVDAQDWFLEQARKPFLISKRRFASGNDSRIRTGPSRMIGCSRPERPP